MDKDTLRFWIGIACSVCGVGLQMTGVPHVVGWLVVGFGLLLAFVPVVAHRLSSDTEPHAPNDLRDVVTISASAGTPREPLPASPAERDTGLAAALAYAVTGKWDKDSLWDTEGEPIKRVGVELKKFEQLACDGSLQVWGMRHQNLGPCIKIPSTYWESHHVHFTDLFRDKAGASAYAQITQAREYFDLMVSSAQFQKFWPNQ